MADVQPFRGWRYDPAQVGSLADVTAPPYDVIGPAERDELYKRHPCNVIRLILNREEPGDGGDERYARAADFLRRWQAEGILQQEREDALYVYHQEFDWEGAHYNRRGFLGRIRLEEFGAGSVFPHEQTMSGPKADRLKLTKACRTNLSPIFGLYPDDEAAVQRPLESAAAGATPLQCTDSLGVVHRLWPITDPTAVNAVKEHLREKPIFIADGHHRYETALNYRNELRAAGELAEDDTAAAANFVLMHFVGMSDPGLAILPTHRLVSGFPSLSSDDVRSALGGHFELESLGTGADGARQAWELMEADGGQDVFGFGTPADNQWLFGRATHTSPMTDLSPDQSEAWRGLGVSLLHKLVIDHLLTQANGGSRASCKYVHLMDEVNEAMTDGSCQLAALVAPAGLDHVKDIASQFEKMPPKSTFFYPKLLSGMVFHSLG